MKLKSRGLGRKELTMDFREYEVLTDGDELLIVGTIHEPVHWDFSIRVCEDDLPGLARVALRRRTIGLVLRSFFKRKKKHHWTVDRDEHIEKVKAVRAARAEQAAATASDPNEVGEADKDGKASKTVKPAGTNGGRPNREERRRRAAEAEGG